MLTVGLKYGVVTHARDWEEVPHVIVSRCGPAAVELPVLIQIGAGWARACFGGVACVYDNPDSLAREFPHAKTVTLKDAVPPPLPDRN